MKEQAFSDYKEIIEQEAIKYERDFEKLYQQLEGSYAYYQGEVIPFLYQPFFFSQQEEDFFGQTSEQLSSILEQVIEEYLTNAEFRSYFNFSSELEELILEDPGYEANFPMARFDIFYYGPEELKFCELNTDGSSGMVKSNILEEYFKGAAAISELEEKYNLENWDLVDSWLETMFDAYQEFTVNDHQPNLAIMDFDNYGMVGEFEYFKELLTNRGYNVKIVDPRELEYKNNKLYCEDFEIDLIYRRAVTTDLMEHYYDLEDLWQAYKNHDVCLVGSFRSQIIHNKIIFAILHDQEKVSFLSEEERKFIKQYIPYTELLDTENREQLNEIIAKQEQLVLKPLDDYGANGVLVGTDLAQEVWKKEVTQIWEEGQNYLAQEFCSLPEEEFVEFNDGNVNYSSYKYILGLFVYDQEFKGVYTRADQQNVIASSTGCVTLPNFKVKEK
ncbi:circularly permuted type 2 ATP-grasp protein [Halanaerobacter jeridensis]|uniref:circularly permuted type 2 ATP-grasp protein n=1 Tax=Halanaerobacter jeridensis TaxID=706427 RepID=UPI001EF7A2FB|nr:circularly permuted type 2 ATP-grasp protein [Halanaerobacter jeridensis]